MSGKKLSRDEVEKRRAALRRECRDYAPTRGGYQCQHYAGKGGCKREDYFMCVVWAKRHPEQMYHLEQSARPGSRRSQREQTPEQAQAAAEPTAEPVAQPPRAQVFDLARHGIEKHDDDRHLLAHPELLTEEAIEALCALGIEITVQTSTGMEVTLVPELTEKDRCELTFSHARTIVMVLQVFPGATVAQIVKPAQQEVS